MAMWNLIRKLYLGSSVAKFDTALQKYFVETEPFRALVLDRTDVVAGDKGTGKTASLARSGRCRIPRRITRPAARQHPLGRSPTRAPTLPPAPADPRRAICPLVRRNGATNLARLELVRFAPARRYRNVRNGRVA